MKRFRALACNSLVLFTLFMGIAQAQAQMKPELAAGFSAGFVCSGVFQAGRSVEQIMLEELGGLPDVAALPTPVVDRENKVVTVAYEEGKPPRVAVFVEDLGTVIMPVGSSATDRPLLPEFRMPNLRHNPEAMPWPDGDQTPEGGHDVAVQSVVEQAFDTTAWPDTRTIGVVVVHKDKIIAERYASGWDKHTPYRTWSTAKSMANAIVGILVKQGKLTTAQAAPIPSWQGADDARKAITIENLLEMSSGLKSPGAMTYSAYWGGIDSAADAAAGELKSPPGTRWMYANYDTLLLMKSAREVIKNDAEYLTLPRRELFNRIGMRHTFPEVDAFGNFVLSSQVYTTPRDLARFGLLYLHDGMWHDERILPEGWVKYSTTPAPAYKKSVGEDKRGYGKQWWLYGGMDGVPPDTYSTAGNRGQFCTVVPSRDLVVVRMGIDPMWQADWSQPRFVAQVLKALGD